jgi:hypothetical protein
MKIFKDIANRVTGNDILCLELSKDRDGKVSLTNSIDGIPVNIEQLEIHEYTLPHQFEVITIDNSINDSIDESCE